MIFVHVYSFGDTNASDLENEQEEENAPDEHEQQITTDEACW